MYNRGHPMPSSALMLNDIMKSEVHTYMIESH